MRDIHGGGKANNGSNYKEIVIVHCIHWCCCAAALAAGWVFIRSGQNSPENRDMIWGVCVCECVCVCAVCSVCVYVCVENVIGYRVTSG